VFFAVMAAMALSGPASAGGEGQTRFTILFNGKDLTGFVKVGADKTDPWSVKEGVIDCTGKPNGYLKTEKSYKNYVLKFDWRYLRPEGLKDDKTFGGNSGCLVHIQPPDKVWPKCVEVQGMNREHGKIFAIGGAKGKFSDNSEARWKALRPVGEWNTTEVISQDGTLTSKINGTEISTGKSELTEGPIGWQAEGAPIQFRNIIISEKK
jgi:hypothetical protein